MSHCHQTRHHRAAAIVHLDTCAPHLITLTLPSNTAVETNPFVHGDNQSYASNFPSLIWVGKEFGRFIMWCSMPLKIAVAPHVCGFQCSFIVFFTILISIISILRLAVSAQGIGEICIPNEKNETCLCSDKNEKVTLYCSLSPCCGNTLLIVRCACNSEASSASICFTLCFVIDIPPPNSM